MRVNISERKSGTERTKKRKKREVVVFFHRHGRNWYCSESSRSYTDVARATITRDIFIPKSQQAKHTKLYHFAERLSFAEQWKRVAESSELSRAHRAQFSKLEIRTQKSGTFKKVKSGKAG